MALLLPQLGYSRVWPIYREDADLAVWWSTRVECAGALARTLRNGEIDRRQYEIAAGRLAEMASSWSEVDPVDEVRVQAARLVDTHVLRTADAFQLGAALHGFENREKPRFVCLDARLRGAALLEGFDVLPLAETVHESCSHLNLLRNFR